MILLPFFYYIPKIIDTIKIVVGSLFSSNFLTLGIIPGTGIQLNFDSYIISVGIIMLLVIAIKTKIPSRLINVITLSRKQGAIDLISI